VRSCSPCDVIHRKTCCVHVHSVPGLLYQSPLRQWPGHLYTLDQARNRTYVWPSTRTSCWHQSNLLVLPLINFSHRLTPFCGMCCAVSLPRLLVLKADATPCQKMCVRQAVAIQKCMARNGSNQKYCEAVINVRWCLAVTLNVPCADTTQHTHHPARYWLSMPHATQCTMSISRLPMHLMVHLCLRLVFAAIARNQLTPPCTKLVAAACV
jgi:hypothetical protein